MLWWLQINLPAVVSYPVSSLALWYFQSSNTPRRDDTVLSSTSTQRHRSTCRISLCVLLGSVAEIIHSCQLGINVKVQTVVGRLSLQFEELKTVPQTRVTVLSCRFHICSVAHNTEHFTMVISEITCTDEPGGNYHSLCTLHCISSSF